VLQLRDGHVVVSAQPVLQAAQNLPFVFERLRIEDVNFQGKEADWHFRSNAVAARFSLDGKDSAFPSRKTA
jgi:hypothetical protein